MGCIVIVFFLSLFSPSAIRCIFLWTIQSTDLLQQSYSYQIAGCPPFHPRSPLSMAEHTSICPVTSHPGYHRQNWDWMPLVLLTQLPPSTLPLRGATLAWHGSTDTLSKALYMMKDTMNAGNMCLNQLLHTRSGWLDERMDGQLIHCLISHGGEV